MEWYPCSPQKALEQAVLAIESFIPFEHSYLMVVLDLPVVQMFQ